ncbi:MAG: shikimate dehydrogenase [Clostridia bacterium]|nr:shikimate dehydrogenase [Clostridia bacterium]
MNVKKLRLALVGKDVSKSTSGKIHVFILARLGVDCEYTRYSVSMQDFDSTMRTLMGDFDGFNVTIPYKRDVMGYLSEVTGDALDFGAVNTVVTASGKGYNTDGAGFMLMLREANIEVKNKKILVLGGGGSGRSTAAILKKAGADVYMYQRRREKLLETCAEIGVTPADGAEIGGFDILVNCTGVGMHDSEGRSPVTAQAFEGASVAIDLIYTPEKSEFLRLAEAQGLQILNGAAMLFYQAYYADCLYLDITPNDKQATAFYRQFIQK